MENQLSRRKRCRTVDLKTMFHGLANAVRLRGEHAYCQPIKGGLSYQFVIGTRSYHFTVLEGGAL